MAGNSTGAIKAGRAFVELFVEDNKLYRGLDLAGAKLQAWGGKLRNMGAALGAGGGAILAPLLASLKEVTSRANDMQLLADRVGESVGTVSTLAGGFERAGVDAEAFAGILEGFRVKVAEAADANGYLLENLKSLGPAARMAGLPVREMLGQVADRIAKIPTAVQQLRAAKGLGLESILPQLRKGRAGIEELFANGSPGGITNEQGRQAVAVTKAVREAWHDFKDTLRQVGFALLPTAAGIADMKEQFKGGLRTVRDWIKENKGVVLTVAAVGAGMLAAGVVAIGLGLTVAAVGKGIILTVAAVKLAFAVAFSPITWAIAAAAGGMYLFATRTETGRRSVANLRGTFAGMADVAKDAFGAAAAAVQAGDYARAWQIGLALVRAEWALFTIGLADAWDEFRFGFTAGWKESCAGLKLMFVDMGAFILKTLGAGMGKGADKLRADIERGRQQAHANIIDAERDRNTQASEARRMRWLRAQVAAGDARLELRSQLAGGSGAAGGSGWAAGIMGQIAEAVGGIGAGGFHGPTRLADATKGGFGSFAIGQQMAFGDSIPQQQLDAMRGLNVNTAQIPQMARDLNTVARGGRLN